MDKLVDRDKLRLMDRYIDVHKPREINLQMARYGKTEIDR